MMYKTAFTLAALVAVASTAPFRADPGTVVPGAKFPDANEKRQYVLAEKPRSKKTKKKAWHALTISISE